MMESSHPRHPSFGLRWEFLPGEDLTKARELDKMGFSHWSLRLETHLKYGGAVTYFLEERAKSSQLRFFSDYLPVAPLADWDPVHALAAVALLETTGPARLTCRKPLTEVPPPQTVLKDLLSRLPASIEVSVSADNEAAFETARRSGEISMTVGINDWLEDWEGVVRRHGDLISEIEIDPLALNFSVEAISAKIRSALTASEEAGALDIVFVLPAKTSIMTEAALRAAAVRDRVLTEGWAQR